MLPSNQILIHHADCRVPPWLCHAGGPAVDWLPHTSRASRRRTEGARARVIAVRNNGKDDPSLRSVGTRKHCHSLLRIRFLYCLLPSQNLPQIAISVGRGKVHTSPQQSSWKKVEASIVQHLNKSGSLDNMVTLTFISWTLYRLDTAGKE